MYYHDTQPVELTKSKNIMCIEKSSLNEELESITLEFSRDGQKLIFIDNRVIGSLSYLTSRANSKFLIGP